MNILTWYIFSVSFSSKCSLVHNYNVFGSCIIHILYTGCAKIKKIIPAPNGQTNYKVIKNNNKGTAGPFLSYSEPKSKA